MSKVDYNRDSFNQCLCGGCPVSRFSECITRQNQNVDVDAIEREGKMPEPAQLGGLYCATGRSACHDMSGEKSCLCPACPVEIEVNLNSNYYCVQGRAEEVVQA